MVNVVASCGIVVIRSPMFTAPLALISAAVSTLIGVGDTTFRFEIWLPVTVMVSSLVAFSLALASSVE